MTSARPSGTVRRSAVTQLILLRDYALFTAAMWLADRLEPVAGLLEDLAGRLWSRSDALRSWGTDRLP